VSRPLLEVRDLGIAFDGEEGPVRAVDGVSFRLRAGEARGLVGESGCGKTVTCLALLGLVPSPGRLLPGSSIAYRGRELVGAPEAELRRVRGGEIAMVFQDPSTSLNPVLSVGVQVGEAVEVHRGLSGREVRAEVVRLLREVGLPEPRKRVSAYPHELSGGMRQRVMLAIALAGEPRILVADEPTTALDVSVQAQILALLRRIRRERGMALLLVSHDLAVVAEVCERVGVMYGGRIVEEGAWDPVFRRSLHPYTEGLLASLPGAQGRGERLRPIPGSVPGTGRWPSGCRFRDRCRHAWERCLDEPPLLAGEPGSAEGERGGAEAGEPPPHRGRCWLVEEPERRVAEEDRGDGGGPSRPGRTAPDAGRGP